MGPTELLFLDQLTKCLYSFTFQHSSEASIGTVALGKVIAVGLTQGFYFGVTAFLTDSNPSRRVHYANSKVISA